MTTILVPASYVDAPAYHMAAIFIQAGQERPVSYSYEPAASYASQKEKASSFAEDVIDHRMHPGLHLQAGHYDRILKQPELYRVIFAQDDLTHRLTAFSVSRMNSVETVIDEIYAVRHKDRPGRKILRHHIIEGMRERQSKITASVPNKVTSMFEENGFVRTNRIVHPYENKMVCSLAEDIIFPHYTGQCVL